MLPPVNIERPAQPRRSRFVRAGISAWLVVHALFVMGLPVLDGWLGHAHVVAHWEDQSDRDCPPRHDTDTCGICHVVSHASAEAPRVAVAAVRVLRVAMAPAERVEGPTGDGGVTTLGGPRGPPQG